jgi:hypothetical protein
MGWGQFSNPIAGGIGTLIRAWLRSVNYVAGLTGWQISKDGDAEFNNATIRGQIYVSGDDGAYITIATFSGTPFQYLNPSPPVSLTPVDAPASFFASTSSFSTGYTAYLELTSPILQSTFAARVRILSSTDDASVDPYVIVDSNSGAHPVTLWVIGSQRLTSPGNLDMDGDLNLTSGNVSVTGTITTTGNVTVGGNLVVTGDATIPSKVCRARQATGGQALTSAAWTALTLDAESTDIPGWHDNATNPSRITPNVHCRCRVSGGVAFAGNVLGNRRGACVGLNGALLLGTAQMVPNSGAAVNLAVASVETVVDFNGTTDYVEVFGFVEGGAGITSVVSSPLTSTLVVELIQLL